MRLKLVLLVSLIAALIATAASVLIVVFTRGSFLRIVDPQFQRGWELTLALETPWLLTALLGSLFVYRHTARRRKLQAALTLILVPVLSLSLQVAWLLLPPVLAR
jgi:hypothetical protein